MSKKKVFLVQVEEGEQIFNDGVRFHEATMKKCSECGYEAPVYSTKESLLKWVKQVLFTLPACYEYPVSPEAIDEVGGMDVFNKIMGETDCGYFYDGAMDAYICRKLEKIKLGGKDNAVQRKEETKEA